MNTTSNRWLSWLGVVNPVPERMNKIFEQCGAALAVAVLWILPVSAEEWKFVGTVGLETRVFLDRPEFPGQEDDRVSASVFAQPELTVVWNEGADRINVVPFGRYDDNDSRRTHFDLREANWLHEGKGWDLLVGIGKVFWGVAESRHIVDIINQTDAVEDIDQEDKLGQPMVALTLEGKWGAIRFFALPGFREQTFPEDNARLSGRFPVSRDSRYESGAKDRHVDFAVRWSHAIGEFDIGLGHFRGTSREPRLPVEVQPDLTAIVVPTYDQIDQTSLDAQYTMGATLWKLEAITRSGHGKRFAAAVMGLEHTLVDVWESGADVGLLAEYLYDGRENHDQTKAPSVSTDKDIFVGLRLTLNDTSDTTMITGAVIDQDTQATLISFEGQRRLGDYWKAELEARMFRNVPGNDALASIRNDSFITLRLARFF